MLSPDAHGQCGPRLCGLRELHDHHLAFDAIEPVQFLDGDMGVGSDLELDDGTGHVHQVWVAVQERADVSRDRVARTKDPGELVRVH